MIYLARTMEACELVPFGSREVAVFSRSDPDAGRSNQDAAGVFAVSEDAGVLAVADGAGGEPSGEEAARVAVCTLRDTIERAAASGAPLRGAVLDGFERANQAILELGIGAMTTLAVAEIDGRALRTYHAGDSKILVTGQRGKLKLLTTAHSPVGYAVEAGVIDDTEAMHHEDRNVVSNFVGSSEMRIEVGPVTRLAPFDTVVVGSDGLFDNLHWEEIVEGVRKGPLARAATRLLELSARRMITPVEGQPSKPDDITLMLFRPGVGA